MDLLKARLLWVMFLVDSFHSAELQTTATNICGYIETVSPAINEKVAIIKFIPVNHQHDGYVYWSRDVNPWQYIRTSQSQKFSKYKLNGTHFLAISNADSQYDAVSYKAEFRVGTTTCTSGVVKLSLIELKDCGLLYLRSKTIFENEPVELVYYPATNVQNYPSYYYRDWKHNDRYIKCEPYHQQSNSKYVEYQDTNGDYVLKIYNFNIQDQGAYTLQCSSGTFTEEIDVIIPVPPNSVTLSPLTTIDGCENCIVGAVWSNIDVVCRVYGGTLPITVELNIWNKRFISTSSANTSDVTFRVKVFVYQDTKIICKVNNSATRVPLTTEAYVYGITVSSPTLYVPSKIIEGNPVNITCMLPNIRPHATNLTMVIGEHIVDDLAIQHEFHNFIMLYTSWITLNYSKRVWNTKKLKCCGTNYGDNKCSDTYSLKIEFPPESVSLKINAVLTRLSDFYDISVFCFINGSNPACDANWDAPSRVTTMTVVPTLQNASYGSITSIITAKTSVSSVDIGRNITCTPTCSNFVNIPTRSWPILVPYLPRLELNTTSSTHINITKGSIAYIKCTSESHPPSNITWLDVDNNSTLLSCTHKQYNTLHQVFEVTGDWNPHENQDRITECTLAVDTKETDAKTLSLSCKASHIFGSTDDILTIDVTDDPSADGYTYDKSTSTNTGILAGTTGGGLLALLVICLITLGIYRHKRNTGGTEHNHDDNETEAAYAVIQRNADVEDNVLAVAENNEIMDHNVVIDNHEQVNNNVEVDNHDSDTDVEEPSNDHRNQNEHNLVYADLEFAEILGSSTQPIEVKRLESEVEYVGIDFVKSADLSEEPLNLNQEEENIYMNQ